MQGQAEEREGGRKEGRAGGRVDGRTGSRVLVGREGGREEWVTMPVSTVLGVRPPDFPRFYCQARLYSKGAASVCGDDAAMLCSPHALPASWGPRRVVAAAATYSRRN